MILDEIRRTAAENGGKPLGWRKLQTASGIRDTDWQKYWARFAEACREAGFEPNLKTTAYSEEDLVQPIAMLARHLGRFPIVGDIRVKAHADLAFPSEKTYRTRFRTKAQMVAKVAAYCSAHSELADVLQWCQQPSQPPVALRLEKADTSNDGFVYLLKSGRFYKIGRTNSIGMREYTLKIQLPEQAKAVHHIKTDDPVGIEAYWHKRFDAKRKNGEWFDLSAQDVSAFRRRKFM